MTPTDYENLVATITNGVRKSAKSINGLDIGSGSKNRIHGASGYKHQIDISLQDCHRTYIIECKRWSEKVGVQEVLVLASRAEDIRNKQPGKSIKAILASTQGMTKNAKKIAEHFDIDIEIVKSASEFGIKIGQHIHVGVQSNANVGSSAEADVIKA